MIFVTLAIIGVFSYKIAVSRSSFCMRWETCNREHGKPPPDFQIPSCGSCGVEEIEEGYCSKNCAGKLSSNMCAPCLNEFPIDFPSCCDDDNAPCEGDCSALQYMKYNLS